MIRNKNSATLRLVSKDKVMTRMYEVYMLNRLVLFTEKWTGSKSSFVIHEPDDKVLKDLASMIRKHPYLKQLELTSNNVESLWMRYCLMYREILAAGCLVENRRGDLLWIERNGKWDLPKGKVEKSESIEQAAIREVQEETGIGSLSIVSDLGKTYHTYDENGTPFLKTTFWFHARHDGERTKGEPQSEEGITSVQWHAQPTDSSILKKAYPSLIHLSQKLSESLQ